VPKESVEPRNRAAMLQSPKKFIIECDFSGVPPFIGGMESAMRKIDEYYIMIGLFWLVFGMSFGIWLGITEQFNFRNSHAHANLVGFVTSVLFGLIYRFFPAMKKSRLAVPQFLTFQAGALLLITGKIIVDATGDTNVVKLGAIVALAGAIMMPVVFLRHREPVSSAPPSAFSPRV
jgi:hypothetical protein